MRVPKGVGMKTVIPEGRLRIVHSDVFVPWFEAQCDVVDVLLQAADCTENATGHNSLTDLYIQ